MSKEIGSCNGYSCPEFKAWHDDPDLISVLGDHTWKEAGHTKADDCASMAGCIFEQTVEIQGDVNA